MEDNNDDDDIVTTTTPGGGIGGGGLVERVMHQRSSKSRRASRETSFRIGIRTEDMLLDV